MIHAPARRHPQRTESLQEVSAANGYCHTQPSSGSIEVSVLWIINLIDESVEVHIDPTGSSSAPTFRQQQTYRRGESVPLVLDGNQTALVPVDELLP